MHSSILLLYMICTVVLDRKYGINIHSSRMQKRPVLGFAIFGWVHELVYLILEIPAKDHRERTMTLFFGIK